MSDSKHTEAMKDALAALFFVGNMQNDTEKFRERIMKAYEESGGEDSSFFWERLYNLGFFRKMTSEDLSQAIVLIATTLFQMQDDKNKWD